jgi:hypothetical protein
MGKRKYNTEEERKEAIRIRSKKWNKNNLDKVKNSNKNYREINSDKINNKQKIYYEANKEKVKEKYEINKENNLEYRKEYAKKYRETNPNYFKEYYQKHKNKIIENNVRYEKNKLLSDELFKLKHNIRTLVRNSFSYKKYKKNRKTNDILGCSFEDFKQHLESKFEPWMNWENYGLYNGELNYGWDIDHIIPLSTANTENDVIQLNHYTNLRPLCGKVNRDIKRAK